MNELAKPIVDFSVKEIQNNLSDDLVGIYLFGSLCIGDFDPENSDIDLVVITNQLPSAESLEKVHDGIFEFAPPLSTQLECLYIAKSSLTEFQSGKTSCLRVDRGSKDIQKSNLNWDWIINQFAIHQAGQTLTGQSISEVFPDTTSDDLLLANKNLFDGWWLPMAKDSRRLENEGYRFYAIQTMARILATIELKKIISKKAAIDWAIENLSEWSEFIKKSGARDPSCSVADTQKLIEFVGSKIH